MEIFTVKKAKISQQHRHKLSQLKMSHAFNCYLCTTVRDRTVLHANAGLV